MSVENTTEVAAVVATAATADNNIKFRDDLTALKETLKPLYAQDSAAGTLVLPAGTFFANAPENVTEETYAAMRAYTDLFNNAATQAESELSVEMFKANSDLQTVTASAPIWKKDAHEGAFKRTGTSRNVKTGEVSNYVGSIGVGRINVVSTRTQAEWQGIKQNMRNLAEAAGL
jgi:hypothetical protein